METPAEIAALRPWLKSPAATTQEPEVLRIAEGVGSMTYDRFPTGSRRMNRELRQRLVVQDAATVVVLLVVFALTILASCLSIYQVSPDPSPVLFYSDPKYFRQRLVCASADMEAFLQAFNTQPQTARLRLIGKRAARAATEEGRAAASSDSGLSQLGRRISQQGQQLLLRGGRGQLPQRLRLDDPILFDVCLDLTPFIASDGRLATDEDAAKLQQHLASTNPLEVLLLRKRVEWACWEDVATNIKQRLRTLGFAGEVDVLFEAQEETLIYRNHPWQNFVRSRITQALVLLSVVGCIFWLPYLWVRTRTVRVESRFQITLDLARYWELLAAGLHATEGFHGDLGNLR